MKKQDLINEWLKRPIEKGDRIDYSFEYDKVEIIKKKEVKSKKRLNGTGYVVDIINDDIHGLVYLVNCGHTSFPSEMKLENISVPYSYQCHAIKAEYVVPNTDHLGLNPFGQEPERINFYSQTIESLLSNCGYKKNHLELEVRELSEGATYGGANFNPYVTDKDGNKQYYQRDFVWTLEQKQALIESIFNFIEIGKFVFRYNSWSRLEKEAKESGHGYNYDIVDGKQRMGAIIDYVQNKITDVRGDYFSDLSEKAQREFLSYDRLTFGKMEERTTDQGVIDTFLTLNFTGVQMSAEHIEFVKGINSKMK